MKYSPLKIENLECELKMEEKEIETRKLVKLGKSSIVVSLPKGWVDVMGLERGNEVKIQRMGDGTLKIIPREVTPSKGRKIKVDISKIRDEKLLERILMGYYLEGAESLSFTSTEENFDEVKKVAESFLSLIGEGEMEEREGELVLVINSKTEKFSMVQLISEMFGSLLSMFSELKDLIKTKDKTKKDSILNFEEKVDSLYLFALRKLISAQGSRGIVKTIGLKSPLWILGNRLVIKSIEQTADIITKLLDSVFSLIETEIKSETEEALFLTIEEIEDIIPEMINAFRERNSRTANSLFNKINNIQSKIYELMERETGNVHYTEFLTSLSGGLEPFFGILEVVLNRSTTVKPNIDGIEEISLKS